MFFFKEDMRHEHSKRKIFDDGLKTKLESEQILMKAIITIKQKKAPVLKTRAFFSKIDITPKKKVKYNPPTRVVSSIFGVMSMFFFKEDMRHEHSKQNFNFS